VCVWTCSLLSLFLSPLSLLTLTLCQVLAKLLYYLSFSSLPSLPPLSLILCQVLAKLLDRCSFVPSSGSRARLLFLLCCFISVDGLDNGARARQRDRQRERERHGEARRTNQVKSQSRLSR
jgi:hypothetical protein